MIKEGVKTETVWTVEVGDNVVVKHDGRVVWMPSRTDIKMIGLELSPRIAKTIEDMPKYGAKTLKMVVTWE